MAKSIKKNVQLTDVRTINTTLVNKDEVFRMCALAEATNLPLLLVGKPGTAKTKSVIEYAKAYLTKNNQQITNDDFMNKIFILETDEGTKSSEIKGMPDLEKLFADNKYTLTTPVADADVVVINEVDKAASNIRNSLLGVMNERFLFNGKYKIPCKWNLFVATCNEIPKDEVNSPFWDRFILKMQVNRVSAGELLSYYGAGDKGFKDSLTVSVPTRDEINAISLSTNKLDKFLSVAYNKLSDRTLSFVPFLTKAISLIWGYSIDKALIKLTSILIDGSASSELQNKLYSPEIKNILTKIETLVSYNNEAGLKQAIVEIEGLIAGYASKGIINHEDVIEIETVLNYAIDNHDLKNSLNADEAVMQGTNDTELTEINLPF